MTVSPTASPAAQDGAQQPEQRWGRHFERSIVQNEPSNTGGALPSPGVASGVCGGSSRSIGAVHRRRHRRRTLARAAPQTRCPRRRPAARRRRRIRKFITKTTSSIIEGFWFLGYAFFKKPEPQMYGRKGLVTFYYNQSL